MDDHRPTGDEIPPMKKEAAGLLSWLKDPKTLGCLVVIVFLAGLWLGGLRSRSGGAAGESPSVGMGRAMPSHGPADEVQVPAHANPDVGDSLSLVRGGGTAPVSAQDQREALSRALDGEPLERPDSAGIAEERARRAKERRAARGKERPRSALKVLQLLASRRESMRGRPGEAAPAGKVSADRMAGAMSFPLGPSRGGPAAARGAAAYSRTGVQNRTIAAGGAPKGRGTTGQHAAWNPLGLSPEQMKDGKALAASLEEPVAAAEQSAPSAGAAFHGADGDAPAPRTSGGGVTDSGASGGGAGGSGGGGAGGAGPTADALKAFERAIDWYTDSTYRINWHGCVIADYHLRYRRGADLLDELSERLERARTSYDSSWPKAGADSVFEAMSAELESGGDSSIRNNVDRLEQTVVRVRSCAMRSTWFMTDLCMREEESPSQARPRMRELAGLLVDGIQTRSLPDLSSRFQRVIDAEQAACDAQNASSCPEAALYAQGKAQGEQEMGTVLALAQNADEALNGFKWEQRYKDLFLDGIPTFRDTVDDLDTAMRGLGTRTRNDEEFAARWSAAGVKMRSALQSLDKAEIETDDDKRIVYMVQAVREGFGAVPNLEDALKAASGSYGRFWNPPSPRRVNDFGSEPVPMGQLDSSALGWVRGFECDARWKEEYAR